MEKKLDSVLREIADHLGFLGYESEVKDGEVSLYVMLRHLRNPNFMLETFGGAVKCTALYSLSTGSQPQPPELLDLLNELNRQANVLKFYTRENDFYLEAVFPHSYSKSSFGSYWSMVESDFKLLTDGRMAPFVR